MAKQSFKLKVNGSEYEVYTEPNRPLLDVVREDLGLTGSKEGCGTGDCGACTMLLDGAPVTTCLVLVGEAENRDITTVEGIAKNGVLHPVQAAFVEFGALQCGFCIPGMIVSSVALLDRNPHPTEAEIRYGIAGNLCRCTGYTKIVEAIQAASSRM
ncbi:MAG: (2Fe-2S)-binding protein [Dehalococcoidia bacterium]|nr:(2Fe-2S)-binding protein [Dehalococcoidia bacterium]